MSLTIIERYKVKLSAIIFLAISCTSCKHEKAITQAVTNTANTAGVTYQNPVFNHDFPDPNLVEGKDSFFYAYSTQASWKKENFGGEYVLPIIRSKNLVNWQIVGDALSKKPDWKLEGGIWAPDAGFYNNTYFLYYSFSTWGDPNPGIGVATSNKPEGPFTDHGKLFLSKEIGVDNSIDPFFFEEEGKPYIIWGSFHGIYAAELTEDGLHIKGEKFQIGGNAYEGSFICKKDKYYYYLGSTGTCCEGERSTYKVNVTRSLSFTGPYIDKEGNPCLKTEDHCCCRKMPERMDLLARDTMAISSLIKQARHG